MFDAWGILFGRIAPCSACGKRRARRGWMCAVTAKPSCRRNRRARLARRGALSGARPTACGTRAPYGRTCRTRPVSYTHLIHLHFQDRGPCTHQPLLVLPGVRDRHGRDGAVLRPVSYTHLDVYKRQAHDDRDRAGRRVLRFPRVRAGHRRASGAPHKLEVEKRPVRTACPGRALAMRESREVRRAFASAPTWGGRCDMIEAIDS